MKPLCLVYTDHPMCSIDCADAVCEILNRSGLYKAQMIGPDSHPHLNLSTETLQNADCLIMPGGEGDADQFDDRLKRNTSLIQNYIANGGKYLGICMGSYYAGHHYFNLLTDLEAVQYIKRKKSTTKRRGPCTINVAWKNHGQLSIYFHDGAAFVPTKEYLHARVFARYLNNDIAALIQPYKSGKVGVIGPHPEAPKWWFYSQKRLKDGWKDTIRHNILLEFIKELLEQQ